MHLVENNPAHLTQDFTAAIEHRAQDFRCHDQAAGAAVDCHVARHEADVFELFTELPELLIAEGLVA